MFNNSPIGLTSSIFLTLVVRLSFVAFLAFLGTMAAPVFSANVDMAFADDDDDDSDDDDDDDDDDNGGSGQSSSDDRDNSRNRGRETQRSSSTGTQSGSSNPIIRFFQRRAPAPAVRQAPVRRAQPRAPLAQFAEAELVAIGLSDADITALESQQYVVLQRSEINHIGSFVTRLRVPDGVDLAEARIQIQELQPDGVADLNHFYRPLSSADETASCDDPWCRAPKLINWPLTSTAQNSCSTDVKIGIVDTGINPSHEAFEHSNLTVLRSSEENLTASSRKHGTAVTSILIGARSSRSPGLLPDAEVIAVDAFYRAASDDHRSDVYTLVRSLDILDREGAGIVNLSLAGPANALLENMLSSLADKGILVVAAMGNAGPKSPPAYPAAYNTTIAVTAIDGNKKVYRRAGRGDHVTFAAPGVEIWTAASIRGARPKTGTSFATPYVTAVLAVLVGKNPLIKTKAQAVEAMAAMREDLGEPGFDPVFGHGLVNAESLCGS